MKKVRGPNPGSSKPDPPGLEKQGVRGVAAARGLIEAVRRIPKAFRRPETLMLAMAIFASFGAHMPPYISLGALADYWKQQEAERAAKQPVEVSFEWTEPQQPETPEPQEPEQQAAAEPEPEVQPAPEPQPKPQPQPQEKPEPKEVAEVELQQPPPEASIPDKRKQSITQRSDDPEVEPPPDARFLAEESRAVEEESVAMVRDEMRDDPEPEAAAPQDRGVDEAGGDQEDTDGHHEQGQDEGEKVAEAKPPPEPAREAQPSPQREPAEAAQEAREAAAEQAESEPSPALPGTVIQDPLGSFTLAAAEQPSERQRGQRAQEGKQGSRSVPGHPDLRVSWKTFEEIYDAETLARERVPKRRRRSGSSRQERWKEFRAAIENYIVGVRPGNTTALNAAADPFAAYIASFHRHLHREFAHRFLGSLPPAGELSDPQLVTKVEIVLNPDGTLHRVGVVQSSGQMMFDFGAFNAVKSGEPYPQPPANIRSADGRVYLRWALHRNHSQCGTWNAEPYIVKNPPDVMDEDLPAVPGMQLGPRRRRGPG